MGDYCQIRMFNSRHKTITENDISSSSLANCTPGCQHGGRCSEPNVCDCSGTGYMGDYCQIRMFNSHHKTITENDISSSSLANCTPGCQHGGRCSEPNVCDCSGTGYMGDYCQIRMFNSHHKTITENDISSSSLANCTPGCQHGGRCIQPNVCDCSRTGYMDDYCQIRMFNSRHKTITENDISSSSLANCTPGCQHGGRCSEPNVCDCSRTGYMGDYCQTRMLDSHHKTITKTVIFHFLL